MPALDPAFCLPITAKPPVAPVPLVPAAFPVPPVGLTAPLPPAMLPVLLLPAVAVGSLVTLPPAGLVMSALLPKLDDLPREVASAIADAFAWDRMKLPVLLTGPPLLVTPVLPLPAPLPAPPALLSPAPRLLALLALGPVPVPLSPARVASLSMGTGSLDLLVDILL